MSLDSHHDSAGMKRLRETTSEDPAPELLVRALEEHERGEHEAAVELYKEAAEKGSQLACFNLGNCIMFRKGVERNWLKAIEWWKKGGEIKNEDVEWMRELSNDRWMEATKLSIFCLLTLLHIEHVRWNMTKHGQRE